MSVALGMVLVAAIGASHFISLDRVTPALAALIWMSALLLRALAAAFCAGFVVRDRRHLARG